MYSHDDVIKWKHFPRYWPFAREIHRSPVNSPHKGQWRGALMFCLICAWINCWLNNHQGGHLRHHPAHYDVIVMQPSTPGKFLPSISLKALKPWAQQTYYHNLQYHNVTCHLVAAAVTFADYTHVPNTEMSFCGMIKLIYGASLLKSIHVMCHIYTIVWFF